MGRIHLPGGPTRAERHERQVDHLKKMVTGIVHRNAWLRDQLNGLIAHFEAVGADEAFAANVAKLKAKLEAEPVPVLPGQQSPVCGATTAQGWCELAPNHEGTCGEKKLVVA